MSAMCDLLAIIEVVATYRVQRATLRFDHVLLAGLQPPVLGATRLTGPVTTLPIGGYLASLLASSWQAAAYSNVLTVWQHVDKPHHACL